MLGDIFFFFNYSFGHALQNQKQDHGPIILYGFRWCLPYSEYACKKNTKAVNQLCGSSFSHAPSEHQTVSHNVRGFQSFFPLTHFDAAISMNTMSQPTFLLVLSEHDIRTAAAQHCADGAVSVQDGIFQKYPFVFGDIRTNSLKCTVSEDDIAFLKELPLSMPQFHLRYAGMKYLEGWRHAVLLFACYHHSFLKINCQ